MFFELITQINLDRFIVKLYKLNTESSVVDLTTINSLTSNLNNQEYPKDILSIVESLQGITKVEIFDLNNQLLIDSSIAIENFT